MREQTPIVDEARRVIIPRLTTTKYKKSVPAGSLHAVQGKEPDGTAKGVVGCLEATTLTAVPIPTRNDLRTLSKRTGQPMIRLLNTALEEFFVKYRVPSAALFAYQRRVRAQRKLAKRGH